MDKRAKQLAAALIQVQGSAIASFTAETVVPLKGGKKNPMQGRVTKVAEGCNVMFFTNSNTNAYNNMVKKRLATEGKNPEAFQLSPRVWGERIPDTPFVQHKGEIYVEAVFLRAPKIVRYLLDGVAIAKAAIIGLPAESEEGKQGGLDDKVIIRTYKLSSLKSIKMGHLSVNV